MRWLPVLLTLILIAASCRVADGAFPGNGYWGVGGKPPEASQHVPYNHPPRRVDLGPSADPHLNSTNALYGRGLTAAGGSAYLTNEYRGRAPSLNYGYWDGGFNPGNLYGFSLYPHFDRPGFTYWQGGN